MLSVWEVVKGDAPKRRAGKPKPIPVALVIADLEARAERLEASAQSMSETAERFREQAMMLREKASIL